MEKKNELLEKIFCINIFQNIVTVAGLNREYYWGIAHDKTGKILDEHYLFIKNLITDEEYADIENLPYIIEKIEKAFTDKYLSCFL